MEELAGLDAAYAHATQEDHEELKEKMYVAVSWETEVLVSFIPSHLSCFVNSLKEFRTTIDETTVHERHSILSGNKSVASRGYVRSQGSIARSIMSQDDDE